MRKVLSFEDLNFYKHARDLRFTLSSIVKTFPNEGKFLLTDQIKRASRSVTANIAEGYGRYHYQEYIQFCRQSRGSLYELKDHIGVAYDEGYITELTLQELIAKVTACITILNGFINYLEKAKNTAKQNGDIQEPLLAYGFHD